ncbi:MAG TPA: metallophosphoesterase [Terriglobales bacterium]|nr:metallophosphoesterase [Terriglobales bacterium]
MKIRIPVLAVVLSSWLGAHAQVPPRSYNEQITVAQLSDTHIGDKHAPHAKENLKRAVDMINDRHPDAVILSGDIGENPGAWEDARSILKKLKSPLYYVPGNHDVHSKDVDRYRGVFGKDYYDFRVKFVRFVAIDSELLGNYDVYDAKVPQPLPPQTEDESERMLGWLAGLNAPDQDGDSSRHGKDEAGKEKSDGEFRITIGVQHIPVFHDGNYPPDRKPYWIISEPYRSKEMKVLRELGIKHMLVGHWHNGRVFDREGITWHVAPATSWLPWGGELGFAVHTISANGDVRTEFVALPDAVP